MLHQRCVTWVPRKICHHLHRWHLNLLYIQGDTYSSCPWSPKENKKKQLYVNGEKCKFHVSTVSFLGYIIDANEVTVKEMQWFLGFANFYIRFKHKFSIIASPLSSLLKRGAKKLNWNLAAENAFKKVEDAFTSAPLLWHPDPEKHFTVEVDATETGDHRVSQRFDETQKMHPVAFFLFF